LFEPGYRARITRQTVQLSEVHRGMISRVKITAIVLVPVLLLAVLQVHACSWAEGFFYQVTALKGQVVGTTYGLPRWLRQSFAKKHAKLVLYEYRWPRARNDMPPIVKTLETDGKGMFDFGPPDWSLHARDPW
jgi:hypothetical protein